MATGDVRTSITTTGTDTWVAVQQAVEGDTLVALATHRTSAQSVTNPVSVSGLDIPTIHAEETEIGNTDARRAIYLCGLVLDGADTTTIVDGNRILAIDWDSTTTRVAAAWLIEGEFDLGTLQVAVDDSGAGAANQLSPGPLTPGDADALAIAGLVIRHGATGAIAYTDSFADLLQDQDGSANQNGLTAGGALRLASASISTTASWTEPEESTAILAVIDQPGGGGGAFVPDGLTLATTVDAATFDTTGTFAADGITTPTTVDAATFTEPAAAFAADGIDVATTVDGVSFGATGTFEPEGVSSATTVDAANFTAAGSFAVDGITLATTIDDVGFMASGAFDPDGLDAATTVDDAAFTEPSAAFVPDGITAATTVDDVSYTATGQFVPDGITAATTVDAATFTSPTTSFAADPLTLATTIDAATFASTGEFDPDGVDVATVVDPAVFAAEPWQADAIEVATTVDEASFDTAAGAFDPDGVTVATTIDGVLFADPSVPLVTPPERTMVVARENRTLVVPPENRTVVVT